MEPVPEDMGGFAVPIELNERDRQALLGEQNVGVISRVYDVTIRWYIALAMFALIPTLVLFALPRAMAADKMGLIVSVAAPAFVYLWYSLETRMFQLITYWNDKLIAIAELLEPRERVYGGSDWMERVSEYHPTTHEILWRTMIVFAGLGLVPIVAYIIATAKPDFFPELPTPPAIDQRLEQIEKRFGSLEHLEQSLKLQDERLRKTEEALTEQKTVPKQKPLKPKKGTRR